ncbi:uncharacterized protein B0I36DRAFT_323002 [Microdochium trichocladiopsis]|uniref:Uncharacterized protein n=1 Tax=Microdochium trichocladiopsis TaxID=1682393 RepID=A0A9P9BQM4_9PEZI|nr:uncharacterized protein B0I36DRAFT_323002 [Microdochium trichocladiopsis]KAH7031010.1 hypothetical protein B0I36DRAFT_323002 [Microdochium trichocladiopsis]
MAEQRAKIIEDHPIGKGLHAFRESFLSIYDGASISHTLDALDELDQEGEDYDRG